MTRDLHHRPRRFHRHAEPPPWLHHKPWRRRPQSVFVHFAKAFGCMSVLLLVGVALLGMALFGESREFMRIVCILLIVSGVIGLKVFSGGSAS